MKTTETTFFDIRRSTVENADLPFALHVNEMALGNELSRLKEMCSAINEIENIYQSDFKYTKTFEDFKNKLLPIVVKQADEKVLIRDLQARWLSENDIQLSLTKKVRLNREKELNFLLDAFEFDSKMLDRLKSTFKLIRRCFIPAGIKFSQLYDEEKKTFLVPENIENDIRKKHTVFAHKKEHIDLYLLRHQLADALNGLVKHGFGLGHVPYPLNKLLSPDGTSSKTGTTGHFYFKVDGDISKSIKVLPDVEIIPGTMIDENEYDEEGKLKGEYNPISVRVKVNGIEQDIKIKRPGLSIPGISKMGNKGLMPIMAKDMAKDVDILKELIHNQSSVEMYNLDLI
jgi:hypothetical protein